MEESEGLGRTIVVDNECDIVWDKHTGGTDYYFY
jgi:hypothetical protein